MPIAKASRPPPIEDIQCAKPAPLIQRIGHEVHRPFGVVVWAATFIGCCTRAGRRRFVCRGRWSFIAL